MVHDATYLRGSFPEQEEDRGVRHIYMKNKTLELIHKSLTVDDTHTHTYHLTALFPGLPG